MPRCWSDERQPLPRPPGEFLLSWLVPTRWSLRTNFAPSERRRGPQQMKILFCWPFSGVFVCNCKLRRAQEPRVEDTAQTDTRCDAFRLN